MLIQLKLTKPLQALTYLTIGHNPKRIARLTLRQGMIIKPTCPCCSDILLRHIRLAGLYFFYVSSFHHAFFCQKY